MSDRSSESSCEWVILNENEEDLTSENAEHSLNFELSYEAVSNAVSDSIRSSLTSEELEWQYEQFEDYISSYDLSHIEDIESVEFDVEGAEDANMKVMHDDDSSLSALISEPENECLDVTAAPKILSYKHNRNERLNFILNLMLAVVVASAVGLGTGHFLGWSHKCYKSATEFKKAAPVDNLHYIANVRQNFDDDIKEPEKQEMIPGLLPENVSGSTSCLNLKSESISTNQEISVTDSNNIITDAIQPETSIYMNSDVVELKGGDINNNFSNSGLSHISSFITPFHWNEISNEVSMKHDVSTSDDVFSITENLLNRNGVKDIQLELPKEFYIKNLDTSEEKMDEEIASFKLNKLSVKDDVRNIETDLFSQLFDKDSSPNEENNLTNHLRHDLNEVIRSLSIIAVTRLTDFNEKDIAPIENSEIIIKLYNDFQQLINSKITYIDNFVLSNEYKINQKFHLKHLQKMVYCLVDSVDHLMKISFKILDKTDRQINVYKYSNSISKVIFNFNKRWEKNNRIWSETVERVKFRQFKERSFKKENKNWKKYNSFENNINRKNKFKRYSMKS